MTRRLVHCKWCDWTFTAWWTNRRGESRSGMERLRQHAIDEHFDSFCELERKLDDEYFTKTRGA